MKKTGLCLLLISILCLSLFPTAGASGSITDASQLNSLTVIVGVDQGSAVETAVSRELPLAQKAYYNEKYLGYQAVAQGKIDAFAYDRLQMELAIRGGMQGVRLLPGSLGETLKIAVGVSPNAAIPDLMKKTNEFIAEIRADGTLDSMWERWCAGENENAEMPDIPVPENSGIILKVGTSGVVPPYSFFRGNELSGYDIELARRFAAWLGTGLKLEVYDYGAIISACTVGDVDCVMANLQVTPERTEEIAYSDILYESEIGIMVRGAEEKPAAAHGVYGSVSELDGKRIGVQTGTTAAAITLESLPNAQISYFTTFPDMAAALEANKIDAFPGDGLVLRMMAAENPALFILDDRMSSYDCGVVLPKTGKGDQLRRELNEWIAGMKESGRMDALLSKWIETPEDERTLPDYRSLPAPNGVLRVTTEGTYPPMNYYREGELVGVEVEMCALFCEEYGYGLDISSMSFDGMLAAVQSGKFDFALSGIAVTDERKESVNFSDPYYSGGYQMAVLKSDEDLKAEADSDGKGLLDRIMESFEKTFVREGRWRLFVQGVANTLVITLLSVLFGNLLGFLLFMLCRRGNRTANRITGVCLWLVQGMPGVVLLMVLYYIVFGNLSVSGLAVSVFGFTLTFGAAVFGLLKTGVGAIDRGQYEAAYALGYSDRQTFFRFILPQALPLVTGAYRGELVSLLKATAVVGYIAVQDLTKMGDIVRSRTYEAFFPLIAVTVIYFCLEGILSLITGRLETLLNPRRRSAEAIRKGVTEDD